MIAMELANGTNLRMRQRREATGWVSFRPVVAARVGLVGCVKQKLASSSAAADLYTSPLFRGRRRWVEETCDRWYILSAKHGVLEPATVVSPYDETLKGSTRAVKRAWSRRVLDELHAELGSFGGTVFEIHAGADYREWGLVEGLRARGGSVEVPAEGLVQGEQLALYRRGPRMHQAEIQ